MERRKIALGAALTVLSLSAAPAGAQVAVPAPPVDVAPLLPAASSCEVSVLDADSVRVTGAVDPNGLATSYRVEYGLLGLLNLSSPLLSAGSSPDPTAVSSELDGIAVAGSYSCRIVALNSAGETAGSTTTFLVTRGGTTNGSGGSNGSDGSGGTGATPAVNPATGQVVPAGAPGAVRCTLAGTAGKDRLKGTKRAAVICGLGGADRIAGLAGNDVLIGGPGHDRMLGNRGKDRLLGARGNDKLNGGRRADYLFGWKGRDRMSGGRGSDRFVANRDRRGGDRLNGGTGRDRASLNRGDRMRSIERPRIKGR